MKRVIWILIWTLCISAYAAEENTQITCRGKVIDAQGEPITGSKVTAYEMVFDMAGNIHLQLIGELATKADGAFVFETVLRSKRRGREAVIVAVKEGMAVGWATWDMRGDSKVTIELGEPAELQGVIVDENGGPIEGAEVRANLIKEKEWLGGIAPLEWLAVKSDNKGRFLFNNLPADVDVGLLVTAATKATIYTYKWGPPPDFKAGAGPQFKAGQTDIKVALPAEARIEGRIVDANSGEGVAGVKLAVVATFSPAFFYRFVCESGEDGSFSIGGLQSGEYLIRGDFPRVCVEAVSGESTTDVIIARDRARRTKLQAVKSDAELRETVIKSLETEIQFSFRIFEVSAGADISQAGLGKGVSNGVVVHAGQEYVDKLLARMEKNQDVRMLSNASVVTYDGADAKVFYGEEIPYTAGYELGADDLVKPILRNTFDGIKLRVKGKIQDDGDMAHVEVGVQRRKSLFETRQYKKGYDYQVPAGGSYFSTDIMVRKNEPVVIGRLRRDEPSLYLVMTTYWVAPLREPESLVGKALPELTDIDIEFSAADAKGKRVLVCFWDMNQRPSRHCIRELAKRAGELKEKGVTIVAVQASKVGKKELDAWVKKYQVSFPVGMVQGDEEETRLNWGVKSLPWLILTDRQHAVVAEGFSLAELDEKTKGISHKSASGTAER